MRLFPRLIKKETEDVVTFAIDHTEPTRAYLKLMALETVIGFIARSVALSDFRIVRNGKRVYTNEHYAFNVRPNTDQSAYSFWWQLTYKMIFDGEVLAVPTDSGDLLIADSFYREELAVYPDTFLDVTVKDYTFKRTFSMDEVFYLKFGNEKLTLFLQGMFEDYTKLFNRLIENNLRSNQIRGVVSIDTTQSLSPEKQSQLQRFINDMYKAFRDKAVAIVPKLKGFDYTEISNGTTSSQSVDEMSKLKSSLIDEVSDILGVPQKLVHGDIADIDSLMKAYVKFCINPINKMISDELNAKFIEKADYLKGDRIHVIGIQSVNVIENAEAVDKLVASGAYTRNEVRVKFGDEPADDPELDQFVLTKNYQSVEGGEEE